MFRILICSIALSPCLQGVVIASGDGSGNTSAPGDDPGFANVGSRSTASAVYLGNQWVITANHVGIGSVVLGGVTYAVDSGSAVRIQNPTGLGLSTDTDLRMYRLTTDPGLPTLQISTSTPTAGTDVIMIGNGRNRAVSQTMWDVAINPTGNDVWTVTTNPLLAEVKGWETLGTRAIRWGENNVTGTATVDLGAVHGEVLSIYTTFDEIGGMTHEAQGASGDSGGAVFYKEGGIWKLGGITNAVGTGDGFLYDGSPPGEGASDPYPYFGRVTTAADLSRYRLQIEAVMAIPEPSTLFASILGLGLFARRRRS